MKSVMRGVVAICMSVLVFAPSVSAAETVVTAQVLGVRHVVVDSRGRIQQIVSNTADDVTPIVHVGTFDNKPISMSQEVEESYQAIISGVDTERAGIVYVRHSPLEKFIAHLSQMSILPLKPTL